MAHHILLIGGHGKPDAIAVSQVMERHKHDPHS
jgi:hypothetical protein